MKHLIIFFIIVIIFSGCSTVPPYQPVPNGFVGDVASISDSLTNFSRIKGHFFVVESIDRKRIEDSRNASVRTGYHAGYIEPSILSRKVKTLPQIFKISGHIVYAAPIISMFGKNSYVTGEVKFTPEKEKKYVVRGVLSKEYSAVWIEDENGNKVVEPVELYDRSIKSTIEKKEIKEDILAYRFQKKLDDIPDDEYFLYLESGTELNRVLEKIGQPDDIIIHESNSFTGRGPVSDYIYDGLGFIRFWHRGNETFVAKVKPKIDTSSYSLDDAKRVLNIKNKNIRRSIIRAFAENKIADIAILDLFAKKVWLDRNTSHEIVADTMAWLCKILARSKNEKYRELFNQLLNDKLVHKKISRYAAIGIEILSEKK